MKAALSYFTIVLSFFAAGSSYAGGTQLAVQFSKHSRTPKEVQELVTKAFNQKCHGSVQRAQESNTNPFTSFEDNFQADNGKFAAQYLVVYDQRYPKDMEVDFQVGYSLDSKGTAKVDYVYVAHAYDSSYCDTGIYKPADLK